MSKKSRKETAQVTGPSRKQEHLTRRERERQRTLWIIFGSILGVVGAVILIGVIQQYWLKPRAPIAVVNGAPVTTSAYRDRVLFEKFRLEQRFGALAASGALADQLQQYLSNQLPNTVFETMITDEMLRQEAARLGIIIGDDEITRGVQADYGYFPNGTPTPTAGPPTSTPAPTATVGAGTAVPTVGPTGTPVVLTEAQYKSQYDGFVTALKAATGLGDSFVRDNKRDQLLYERFRALAIANANIPPTSLQVRARQIVVDTEDEAKQIVQRLKAGEDFATLAKDVSKDATTKDQGGDLGWFSQGSHDPILERAAFSLQPNAVSEPLQIGGQWTVVQVVEAAQLRPMTAEERTRHEEDAVDRYLSDLQARATIERDFRTEAIPAELTAQTTTTRRLVTATPQR